MVYVYAIQLLWFYYLIIWKGFHNRVNLNTWFLHLKMKVVAVNINWSLRFKTLHMCCFKWTFDHLFCNRDNKMRFTWTWFSILEQVQSQVHYIIISKCVVLEAAEFKREGHTSQGCYKQRLGIGRRMIFLLNFLISVMLDNVPF